MNHSEIALRLLASRMNLFESRCQLRGIETGSPAFVRCARHLANNSESDLRDCVEMLEHLCRGDKISHEHAKRWGKVAIAIVDRQILHNSKVPISGLPRKLGSAARDLSIPREALMEFIKARYLATVNANLKIRRKSCKVS